MLKPRPSFTALGWTNLCRLLAALDLFERSLKKCLRSRILRSGRAYTVHLFCNACRAIGAWMNDIPIHPGRLQVGDIAGPSTDQPALFSTWRFPTALAFIAMYGNGCMAAAWIVPKSSCIGFLRFALMVNIQDIDHELEWSTTLDRVSLLASMSALVRYMPWHD